MVYNSLMNKEYSISSDSIEHSPIEDKPVICRREFVASAVIAIVCVILSAFSTWLSITMPADEMLADFYRLIQWFCMLLVAILTGCLFVIISKWFVEEIVEALR